MIILWMVDDDDDGDDLYRETRGGSNDDDGDLKEGALMTVPHHTQTHTYCGDYEPGRISKAPVPAPMSLP